MSGSSAKGTGNENGPAGATAPNGPEPLQPRRGRMKTVVTAPAAHAIGSTKQLQAQAVQAFTEFLQLARRTVEQAWECGRLLTELKEVMEHGAWLPWLEKNKISQRTAHRLMQLHLEYQISQLGEFGSVDAALKAIPKPQKEEEPESDEPKPLTAHEKWLLERDDLVKENRELKVELQDVTRKADELKEAADHLESELKVDEGYARGRDVLEERQEKIRQLNHRIHDLQEENGSLLRENKHLKRQLKQRNRAIAV